MNRRLRIFWLMSSTMTLAAMIIGQPQLSAATTKLMSVTVAKEVDGDTIHVTMPGGKDETIRMLLIDTPEDVKPSTPVEPFSLQAAAFTRKELPVGKHIFIEEGKPGYQRDKYGRLLAFVYVTPKDMYNEDVVRKGLARVGYIYPPNTQHLAALTADQTFARNHHLGIWTLPGYVTPTGYNMNAVKSRNTGGPSNSIGSLSSAGTSGLKVISSTLNVPRRSEASVTIQTKPGTTGTIEVDYKSGPSHAKGLQLQTANSSGQITWSWKVGSNTAPGSWPVKISAGGKTATLTLHVQ